MLQTGPQPAIVNDLRASLEQDIPEIACLPVGAEPRTSSSFLIRREMLLGMSGRFAPTAPFHVAHYAKGLYV